MTQVIIDFPSKVSLPMGLGPYRIPRRHKLARQANFESRFDYSTVAYDIFRGVDGGVYAVAPHEGGKEIELYWRECFDPPVGVNVRHEYSGGMGGVRLLSLDKICKGGGARNSITFKDGDVSIVSPVTEHMTSFFSDKKVVFTVQKDNDLKWIHDWVQFYVSMHGADSFVIYDNGSQKYDLGALASVLNGLNVDAVIVPWLVRYGPQLDFYWGASQDSSFAQPAAIVHAMNKYLSQASAVLSVDIDELVVPHSGTSSNSCFASEGYAKFRRFDFYKRAADINQHSSYFFRKKGVKERPGKWMVCPKHYDIRSLNFDVHSIHGLDLDADTSDDWIIAHCAMLTDNWKGGRDRVEAEDELLKDAIVEKFLHAGMGKSSLRLFEAKNIESALFASQNLMEGSYIISDALSASVSEMILDRERYDRSKSSGGMSDYLFNGSGDINRVMRVLSLRGNRFSSEEFSAVSHFVKTFKPNIIKKFEEVRRKFGK